MAADKKAGFPGIVADPRHGSTFETYVDWSRFNRDVPKWFEDSIFGIFIHWGPYSVPGWAEPIGAMGTFDLQYHLKHCPYAEWYWNTKRIPGSPTGEYHRQVWDDCDYDRFLDEWKAEEFDASAWAELFAGAGADYVIPTTKHHDGVTLWDAPKTGDRNTVHRGPRRDIVGELADATRENGMEFGVYYSGGLDWYLRPFAPIDGTTDSIDGLRPQDFEYGALAAEHCKDLIDRYQPSVLWNDIQWPDESKLDDRPGSLADLFDYFYQKVPRGVVNDRWGVPHRDYLTSEYTAGLDRETTEKAWEHCRGIGWSFGYNRNETAADLLTPRQICRDIVDKVSRGGRLLLNVGPMASGEIPSAQISALRAIGQWMTTAKPALYGAKPVLEEETPQVQLGAKTGSADQLWHRWVRTGEGKLLLAVDQVSGERDVEETTVELSLDFGACPPPNLQLVAGRGELFQTDEDQGIWQVRVDAQSTGPILLSY